MSSYIGCCLASSTVTEVFFATHFLLIAQRVSTIKRIKIAPERISIIISSSKVFPGVLLLKPACIVRDQHNNIIML